MDHRPRARAIDHIVAATAGLVTGIAAGLIGVGGGEFRLPVLIRVLRLPIPTAAGVNLLIGLCTVLASLLRRWNQLGPIVDDLPVVVTMGAVSVIGAACGCVVRGRFSLVVLKRVVSVYLIAVGLWMLYEAMTHTDHVVMNPAGAERLLLAAAIGFVIAVASGVLGVAGGEMRIPALLYLFAVPIKDAGTLSLAVSIPTVSAGAITDLRLGHIPRWAVRVGVVMGVASVCGALIGAALVPHTHPDVIKGVLGAVLLVATWRMTAKLD